MNLRLPQRGGISREAERLLGSHEGICSVKLVCFYQTDVCNGIGDRGERQMELVVPLEPQAFSLCVT